MDERDGSNARARSQGRRSIIVPAHRRQQIGKFLAEGGHPEEIDTQVCRITPSYDAIIEMAWRARDRRRLAAAAGS